MSGAPGLDTVEGFAALSASLDEPFADRARLLAAAGLDETDFSELAEHWLARLGAGTPESDGLVERYAAAYAKRRRPEISRIPDDAKQGAPGAPSVPVYSPVQAHVSVPSGLVATAELKTPVDVARPQTQISSETSDIDLSKVLSGLSAKMPFDPSRPSAAAVPSFSPSPKAPLSGETVDVNVADLARRALSAGPPVRPPAAPQSPPGAPQPANVPAHSTGDAPVHAPAAPPGKRLIRFDPQTGQPLATPQWVDLPMTPGTPPGKAR